MKHTVKVIPKEEILANRSNAYEFIDFDKQETIEEAAERLYPKNIVSDGYDTNFLGRVGLYLGAKWQQERMYSEEEVLELLTKSHFIEQNIVEWFEQFKKK